QWHWYFLNQDREGSVTHLTDADGTIIERYRYDAFGTPLFYNTGGTQISTTAYNNRFLFTGREYLGEAVYDYRARLYHANLGRFMSEDPKLFAAGDYNLFRYCHNDPNDFTDPMGLDDQALPAGPNHASPLIELSKRQMQFDRSNGAVATAFKAAKDFVIATDKMTGGPEYRALVGNYIRWTGNNRAILPSWAQNILQFIDDTGGVGMGVPVGGVEPVVQFTKVFRVWGDGSKPWGPSWTPVDPRTVPNYRNAAGLPSKNSGRF